LKNNVISNVETCHNIKVRASGIVNLIDLEIKLLDQPSVIINTNTPSTDSTEKVIVEEISENFEQTGPAAVSAAISESDNAEKGNECANHEDEINKDFEGIEFELNSDKIRPQSFDKLNHAADVIKTLDANSQYLVIGAADTRGSDAYNLNLSQRRANAVVKYLTGKGVSSNMLVAEGRGEKDLKYPECEPATACPEWKNEANRRVYFEAK